ncbi:thioredoxin-like protein [Pelagophyceae sp. CCMP2097]|nr:thioredoxin-like protein [Pelagophyceae sp. CCMP2097]
MLGLVSRRCGAPAMRTALRTAPRGLSTKASTASPAGPQVVDVTAATFGEVVMRAPLPVLLQCSAAWCGPCKVLSPLILAECAKFPESIRLVLLDIDVEQELATQLNIKSVPTVFGIVHGQVPEGCTFAGAQSPEFVAAFVVKLAGFANQPDAVDAEALDVETRRLAAFEKIDAGEFDAAAELLKANFLDLRRSEEAAKREAEEAGKARKFVPLDYDDSSPLSVEIAWCLVGLVRCAMAEPPEVDTAKDLLGGLRDKKRERVVDSNDALKQAIANLELEMRDPDDDLEPARILFHSGRQKEGLVYVLKKFKDAPTPADKEAARLLILQFIDAQGEGSPFAKLARMKLASAMF